MLTFFLILFSLNSFANIAEHFGASTEAMAVAGQSSFDSLDAANNFYAPALLADSNKTIYSISEVSIQTNFRKINDIVISSPINRGGTSTERGDIDPNSKMKFYRIFHGSFPLFKSIQSKINLSLVLPSDKFLEASTGDPYRPEYVLYNSRFDRTVGIVSYAQKLKYFNFSIGLMSGIQSNGETFVVATDRGSQTPSSGKMQFNAKPSTALNFSISKKSKYGVSFFSFQDEVKSELTNKASGFTPVGNIPVAYNWDLSSMLFYDPKIYRFGHRINSFLFSLEYQDWSGYQAPILIMDAGSSGKFTSSSFEENYKSRSILIPKIGYQGDNFLFGLSYKQSPLELENNASGNSIDTDSIITSFGYKNKFNLFDQGFDFKVGLQYIKLQSQEISKSANLENGQAGSKIGSESYKVGGSVYALSIGLNWVI